MYSASVAQGTLTEVTHRVDGTAERGVQELVVCLQRAPGRRRSPGPRPQPTRRRKRLGAPPRPMVDIQRHQPARRPLLRPAVEGRLARHERSATPTAARQPADRVPLDILTPTQMRSTVNHSSTEWSRLDRRASPCAISAFAAFRISTPISSL